MEVLCAFLFLCNKSGLQDPYDFWGALFHRSVPFLGHWLVFHYREGRSGRSVAGSQQIHGVLSGNGPISQVHASEDAGNEYPTSALFAY